MKLMYRFSRYIAGALLAVMIVSPGVFAQAPQSQPTNNVGGVSISPPLKEVILGSGLIEAKTSVTLTNNTDKTLNAKIRLVDFDALDEFGGVSIGELDSPVSEYSLAPWMELPGGEAVQLPAKKTVTVPIHIQNRSDLSPGGHYGAAIITVSEPGNDKEVISLKQELASLIFVKKTGGESYGLDLETLTAKDLPDIPTEISLRFKSTGNVHVVPRGYIEVTDPSGGLVSKGIINPESTLVLPGKIRQFVTIMQPVANASSKGKYTVTAYYRFDGQEEFKTRSIEFTRGFSARDLIMFSAIGLLTVVAGFIIIRKLRRKVKK